MKLRVIPYLAAAAAIISIATIVEVVTAKSDAPPRFTVWESTPLKRGDTAVLLNDRVQGRCYLYVTHYSSGISNLVPVLC